MKKITNVGLHKVEYDDEELTEGQAKRQFYMARRNAFDKGTRIPVNVPFQAVNMHGGDEWRSQLKSMKTKMRRR